MKKAIILLIGMFILSGCYSKLKVVVKVADRPIVMANASEIIKHDLVTSQVALENFIVKADEQKKTVIGSIKTYLGKNNEGYEIPEETMKTYSEKYDLHVNAIKTDMDRAKNYANLSKNEEASICVNQANLKVLQFINDLKTWETSISSGTGNIYDITTLIDAGNVIVDRQRFPILGDPMTSFIAKHDNKEIWKSVFNETVSSSLFGNSDIAMILRSNPPENEVKSGDYNNNFTIKGVRMDAADATNAFFTGITQTMNFIASTQGISLPSSRTGTVENPLPSENPIITGMQTDKKNYEAKKKKLEDIRKMLITKIVIEDIQNKNGDDLNAAILRIEAYWNTLKTELNK
ncbi:hypothetical protein ACX0HA_01500 [Flavobacterium hauense]